MFDLPALTQQAKTISFDGPLLIYGAGNTGRAVYAYLGQQGREVLAFVDQNATPGQTVADRPVLSLQQCVDTYAPGRVTLLVAIHNRDVDMPPLLHSLGQWGFKAVLTMIDYANTFPEDRSFRYWLSPRRVLLDNRPQIEQLHELLGDDLSRSWLEKVVTFRLTGAYSTLPPPCLQDQYVPAGLPRWPDPLRLIDCGAYDGDTLELLKHQGYSFEALLAFEPDPCNFSKLILHCPDTERVVLPCGVGASNEMVTFSAGGGEGSHISQEGGTTIQLLRIDDCFPQFRPNLIKMDVEGAELAALAGLAATLRKYRPCLAISLYHRPADLWEIPLLLHSWGLGYRLFLRGHYYSSFDTVLYAYPD